MNRSPSALARWASDFGRLRQFVYGVARPVEKKLAGRRFTTSRGAVRTALIAVNCAAVAPPASPRLPECFRPLWICCKASAPFNESECETLP